MSKIPHVNGLFVTEAKWEGVSLLEHVPQAVAEMFASAKHLKCILILCS